ncbi:hypothetical protein GCM10010428_07680 [Actinosynnema pretiosum subsp. pretiosum]
MAGVGVAGGVAGQAESWAGRLRGVGTLPARGDSGRQGWWRSGGGRLAVDGALSDSGGAESGDERSGDERCVDEPLTTSGPAMEAAR